MDQRDSLGWIAHEARERQRRGELRGKAWTLAQVCEHLALAIRGTAELPEIDRPLIDPPAWWLSLGVLTRLKRRVMKRALLWSGRFPEGVPSPRQVVPSASADLDTAIGQLESALAAFDRKLADRNAKWIYHPLLGRMDGAQWRRFHELHARHHFKFMKVANVGTAIRADL